jgi:carbamoyltransferase
LEVPSRILRAAAQRGSFYEAATGFCGFKPNYDEGKTMGLAPFGDPAVFGPPAVRIVVASPVR